MQPRFGLASPNRAPPTISASTEETTEVLGDSLPVWGPNLRLSFSR